MPFKKQKPGWHTGGVNRIALAKGLVGYWPFWEGAGSRVGDVANPIGKANHGTLDAGTWSVGGINIADGLYGGDAAADIPLSKYTTFTLMCDFVPTAATSSASILEYTDDPRDTQPYLWVYHANSTVRMQMNYLGTQIFPTGVTVGERASLFVMCNKGDWSGVFNGDTIGPWTYGTTKNANAIHVGGGYYPTLGALHEQVAFWDRLLAPSEIKQLSDDPYIMLRRPTKTYSYYQAPAAGGLSIPVARHHYSKNLKVG